MQNIHKEKINFHEKKNSAKTSSLSFYYNSWNMAQNENNITIKSAAIGLKFKIVCYQPFRSLNIVFQGYDYPIIFSPCTNSITTLKIQY